MADLRKVPGAVDVDSSLSPGKPQYGIAVDRPKAAELGVSVADIANTLRLLVAGDKVSDYNEKGEQYEVHVRSIADARNRLDDLRMITVPSSKFGTVPLATWCVSRRAPAPPRSTASAAPGRSRSAPTWPPAPRKQHVLDAIDESAQKLNMGPEYTTGLLGKSKEMAKAFRAFFLAFILAFIFVYLCIAAQFESWLHPITILLSLPLTLPFALVSLLIFHQSLNIFSLLGILVLFAVVKKNSILQIDHTNQLRAAGMPQFEAIVAANRDRLRPILDDHRGLRGRHDPHVHLERRRLGRQQGHQRRDRRRPDALAAVDAAGHAGGLFAVRRPICSAEEVASRRSPHAGHGA